MKNPLFQDTGAERILQGGSWRNDAWLSRVSSYDRYFASIGDYDLSFRIFRTQERS